MSDDGEQRYWVRQLPAPWTEAELALMKEMLAAGASSGDIAKLLPGRTRNSVIGKANRLQLALNAHASMWNSGRLKALDELYNSALGYSREELARELGMSEAAVRNGISRLRRAGGEARHRPNNGSFAKERQPRKRRGKVAGETLGSGLTKDWAPPSNEPVKAPGAVAVNFAELNPNHCRYPVEGEGYGMLYCGAPRYDVANPYCGFHFAIAYQPRER